MSNFKRSVPIHFYEVQSEEERWDDFYFGHLSKKKRGWIAKKIRWKELKRGEASALNAILKLVNDEGKGSLKLEDIRLAYGGSVSCGTVYNHIKQLVSRGIMNKTVFNGKANFYELVDF